MRILNPEQIKNLEAEITSKTSISEEILMENAAHAVFRIILNRFIGYKVLIICGPGNNGGDGLALARILSSEGFITKILFTHSQNYSGASYNNYMSTKYIKKAQIADLTTDSKTVIVDAIFGIGLNRELTSDIELIINKINNSDSPIISLDIPSGVNSTTGQIMGNTAVKANITVSFLAHKMAQFIFPGANFFGEVILSKLSAPNYLFDHMDAPYINYPVIIENRAIESHKGSNGKVLSIAGSENYYGAPYFCSMASLLTGSGYSVLIAEENVTRVCASLAPEVIYKTEAELEELIITSTSIIFGPGLGINRRSQELFNRIIHNNPKKLLIDADGINILSKNLNITQNLTNVFIITPHPGELSNLINVPVNIIEKNRVFYSKDTAKKLNCILVLKGVFTVIASPEGEVYINNLSSATLATAGSGDILSGIIGSLISNMNTINAVRAGVLIHGLAGIIAEEEIGLIGVTSTELLKRIPKAVIRYKKLINN